MRPTVSRICLAVLCVSFLSGPVRSAHPLEFVPEEADFIIVIEKPGKLLDLGQKFLALEPFQNISGIRELYDSTNVRRIMQLVQYFEQQLGGPWQELVPQLTGNGAAVAGKFQEDGNLAGALVVIQGTNPSLTKKFAQVALDLLKTEIERDGGNPDDIKQATAYGADVYGFGNDAIVAIFGSTILFSNKKEAIETALELQAKSRRKNILESEFLQSAKASIPETAPLWAWLRIESVQGVQDLIDTFRGVGIIRAFGGAGLETAAKAPYLAAALDVTGNEFGLSIHFPRKPEDLPKYASAFVPESKQESTLPLLRPKGTISTHSVYWDFAHLWKNRKEVFPLEQELKQFEDLEQLASRFLVKSSITQLLESIGANHRIVLTTGDEKPEGASYQQIKFAAVLELQDPKTFMRPIEPLLRTAGLLIGFQVKVKMEEEKRGNSTIISYHLPEELAQLPPDSFGGIALGGLSPSFARVGDFFVLSSNVDLARNLVDELEKEAKDGAERSGFSNTSWTSLIPLLNLYTADPEADIAQAILDSGISEEEARKEVLALYELIRMIGPLTQTTEYTPAHMRIEAKVPFYGFK